MRYLLFAPTLSYWCYLMSMAAIAVAYCTGMTPWSLLWFLLVIIVGGAIEGVFNHD